MKVFKSLDEGYSLIDVMKRFPKTMGPLLEYHDRVLRGDSDIPAGEREMIAAYVSSLNGCGFCRASHINMASAFGIDSEIVDALGSDIESADVREPLKPILNYVKKLTLEPSALTERDVQAVYDADWSEEALFDAISICGLFNLMNRMVEGSGVPADGKRLKAPPEKLREFSYAEFARSIGVMD